MEIIDRDPIGSSDDLIDRFAVDITSREPISGLFTGLFQAAMLNMTIEIMCAPEFTEEFCEMHIFPFSVSTAADFDGSQTIDPTVARTGADMALALALGISAAAIVLLVVLLAASVLAFVRIKLISRRNHRDIPAELTRLGSTSRYHCLCLCEKLMFYCTYVVKTNYFGIFKVIQAFILKVKALWGAIIIY